MTTAPAQQGPRHPDKPKAVVRVGDRVFSAARSSPAVPHPRRARARRRVPRRAEHPGLLRQGRRAAQQRHELLGLTSGPWSSAPSGPRSSRSDRRRRSSLGIALFISHFAPRRVAPVLGYIIDLLAAVPSVVYGLWGIAVLAPFVQPFYVFLERVLRLDPAVLRPGVRHRPHDPDGVDRPRRHGDPDHDRGHARDLPAGPDPQRGSGPGPRRDALGDDPHVGPAVRRSPASSPRSCSASAVHSARRWRSRWCCRSRRSSRSRC